MRNHIEIQINRGFNLVELMVVIAIAGVLLGIAVPSFNNAMRDSQQIVVTNDLMGTLRLARSEAIKRSTRTSVCARADNDTCGTDWSNGYITFVDNGLTHGVIDNDEPVLRVEQKIDSGGSISNRARLFNTNESPIERNYIRFGPRGTSNWRGSGYFSICDYRGQGSTNAINISLSGDPRRARSDGDGDLISSFGSIASCETDP